MNRRDSHWLGLTLFLAMGYGAMVSIGLLRNDAVEASAVSIPQFASGATVVAKPLVVTTPEIVSAGLVESGKTDTEGKPILWLQVIRVIPSNAIDLATGLPEPDRALRETYTGPWDQGVVLKLTEEGTRWPATTVPGVVEFGE